MPWLQDTSVNSAWSLWGVTYRDVRILDAQNRLRAVYNLTAHDLTFATNRAALKELLLEAARFHDSDNDSLGDDWETLNFGNLSALPGGDFDGDGQDNFMEYAFGSSPTNSNSKATFQTALTGSGANRALELTFRRRAGRALEYRIDAAPAISPWAASLPAPEVIEPFLNLYDGSGAGWTSYRVVAPLAENRFLRIRAVPPPQP